jgi:hypothetical protein
VTGAPSARSTPFNIDCQAGLLEEIRALAVAGCLRLVRGGLDVGGVLFGMRQDQAVTVRAFRRTPIVYALGPTFLLSEQDRVTFAEVLRAHETEPDLIGMVPVGWFVSHPRNDSPSLTENDVAIFDEYLKEPWQITLVLRPGRSGTAQAAFFSRDADGTLRPGKSESGFELTPAAVPARNVPDQAPETQPRPAVAAAASAPRPRRRRWLASAVLTVSAFLLGAAASAGYFMGLAKASPSPALGLTVSEEGSALLLAWNPAAVTRGETATIEVSDSGGSRLLQLTRPQLARGAYPLGRSDGRDVSFRMTAYDVRGSIMNQATTRFVAPPTGSSPELEAARSEADRLRGENAKLKGDVSKEAARAKVFEERARVLEKILRSERAVKSGAQD